LFTFQDFLKVVLQAATVKGVVFFLVDYYGGFKCRSPHQFTSNFPSVST